MLAVIVVGGAAFAGYQLKDNNQTSTTNSISNSTDSSQASSGKTADYSGKGLTEFPKQVLKDNSITKLDISNNNLTGAIPAEIHDLANLEILDLSDNQMTGIPAEVGQLRKLKILDYSNNQITGLPLELGNLTQLQVLDLSGNNVSQQDIAKIRAKLTNTEIKL
jgi:Leucine-rich repeat (LRR) protein